MYSKLLLVLAIILGGSELCVAQSHTVSGFNASISVEDSSGLLSIYRVDGAQHTSIDFLAYASFKVDDSVYSNNPIAEYVGAHSLGKSTVTRVGDSIVTTWNVAGLEISQIVFVAPFWSSDLAVIRFRAENPTLTSHRVEAQFLLGVGEAGDIGYVSTDSHYDLRWETFAIKAPRFRSMFIASATSFADTNKANVSIGVWSDSILDLVPPDSVVIGDVHDLSHVAFGVPAVHKSFFSDAGVLNRWRAHQLAPGETARLGSFAYGPGRPKVFVDSAIFTYTFYQDHYRWNDSAFAVARPDVEMFLYDRQPDRPPGLSIPLLDATLTPADRVRIGAGSPIQRLYPEQNSSFGVTYWNVEIDTPFTLGQIVTGFTITESWEGHAPVSTRYPITIDAHHPHSLYPVLLSSLGTYDGSECNNRWHSALAIDSGNSDGILNVHLADSSNMTLVVNPLRRSDTLAYSVRVVDSMKDGTANVVLADYVDSTNATYTYCTLPDTHAPILGTLVDHGSWLDLSVTDSAAWDRGLTPTGFRVYDTVNCWLANKIGGYNRDRYTRLTIMKRDVNKVASFCLTVPELSGNASFDTCITWPAPSAVGYQELHEPTIAFDRRTRTLRLSAESTIESVEVLDLLGRRVLSLGALITPASVNLSGLARGTYIVRVAATGRVLSERIQLSN